MIRAFSWSALIIIVIVIIIINSTSESGYFLERKAMSWSRLEDNNKTTIISLSSKRYVD